MTIRSPENNRERILMYGPPGSGKSKAYVDLYDETDSTFFVLDTDIAAERMFSQRDTTRLVVAEAFDYVEAATAFLQFGKGANTGDWIIVDMISPTWQWCQDYWASKRLKGIKNLEDMAVWMPESDNGIDYNWVEINRLYNKFMMNILKSPAHIMVIASEDAIMEGKWQNDTDRAFIEVGKKPRGNKQIPHLFHTVIRCHKLDMTNGTEWRMTSAKEREGRECDWNKKDMTDLNFVDEYMIEIADWTKPQRRRRKT